MSIIQELEYMKYRFVIDLLKKEEQYDKKRSVITAYDVQNMCYDRFQLMQEVLLPLKKKLGNRVDVTDIKFARSNDESGIIVKYLKDGKSYILSISNIEGDDIAVTASDLRVQSKKFIEDNRSIIQSTFKDINDNDLDEDIIVKSTTGRLIIKDNCDSFNISDTERKVFSLEEKYSTYAKNGSLSNPKSLVCNYPKLKELLIDEDNILSLYQHIHVYEDSFPKTLTKKLTNR